MLKLEIMREPKWLDLGEGVRVKVVPPDATMRLMAMRETLAAMAAVPDTVPEEDRHAAVAVAEAKAFAKRAIVAWEGVHDAEGQPIKAPRPDLVELLFDVSPTALLSFINGYVAPLRQVEQEKNASAPSSSGSSGEARNTARPARRKAAKSARGS